MLRNLKVGTKLFVILLAPMLVIVGLVAVGVRDRRSVANDAKRVEDVSSFGLVGNELQSQLEAEELYTAVVAASRGATGTSDLAAQRIRTDAALARYQDAINKLDQGPSDGALALSIGLAKTRLSNLGPTRLTFDTGTTEPFSVSDIYTGDSGLVSAVVGVNAVLAGEANGRDLLRGLDGMSRIEQLQAAVVGKATLVIGAAQRGAFTDANVRSSARTARRTPVPPRPHRTSTGPRRAWSEAAPPPSRSRQ